VGRRAPPSHRPDFLEALEGRPAAKAFYERLNGVDRCAIYYRIQDSRRAETRARRIVTFVDTLERGEKLYPREALPRGTRRYGRV
jgi:uncharacterized protein YdeI (YjbR/CyaY-like superfamily)